MPVPQSDLSTQKNKKERKEGTGMDKFVEIFCDIDDFFRVFIPEREKQLIADRNIKRKCPCRMAMSEIMTIFIAFHTSNHRDFKNYYKGYIAKFYHSHFPALLSYTRFLEVMPKAIVPFLAIFQYLKVSLQVLNSLILQA